MAGLTSLPPELIYQILGHNYVDNLDNVSRVSKSLRAVISDDRLWKAVLENDAHCTLSSTTQVATYKQLWRHHWPDWSLVRNRLFYNPCVSFVPTMVIAVLNPIDHAIEPVLSSYVSGSGPWSRLTRLWLCGYGGTTTSSMAM